MKKESFILYANQYAALERLTDGQLGALFRAIYRWLNGDAVKAETLEPQLFVAYKFLTLQIEINNEKYLQSKQRREAGKKETQGKRSVNAVNNSSSSLTHACVNVNENENVSLFANKQTTMGETPADTDTKTEEKEEEEIRNKCMNFMKYWNQCVKKSGTRMSQVRALTPPRVEAIREIMRVFPAEQAAQAINNAMRSPFCNGETRLRPKPVDFDWLLKVKNFTLALEGSL
jgi:hypothetical protein